jgi:hypothetical protein
MAAALRNKWRGFCSALWRASAAEGAVDGRAGYREQLGLAVRRRDRLARSFYLVKPILLVFQQLRAKFSLHVSM